MIVDATGLVLGRLASVTATLLLAGDEVKIVNAEKAIITGRRESIYEEYFACRDRGTKERGPYFPRRPEMILKRTVRGMLPYKLKRGRDAMSRSGFMWEFPAIYRIRNSSSLWRQRSREQ